MTRGKVYAGEGDPGMQGIYLYGEFGRGRIWGLHRDEGVWRTKELSDIVLAIGSFGEDDAGKVCLVDVQVSVADRAAAVP